MRALGASGVLSTAQSTKYDGLTRMIGLLRMVMECGARQTALYNGMGGASIGIPACIYTRIYGRRHANDGALAAYRRRYIKNLTKGYLFSAIVADARLRSVITDSLFHRFTGSR